MTPDEIEAVLLARYGVRTDRATRDYAAAKLDGREAFPILAGDARTGRPVRQVVVPAELVAAAAATA